MKWYIFLYVIIATMLSSYIAVADTFFILSVEEKQHARTVSIEYAEGIVQALKEDSIIVPAYLKFYEPFNARDYRNGDLIFYTFINTENINNQIITTLSTTVVFVISEMPVFLSTINSCFAYLERFDYIELHLNIIQETQKEILK